MHLKNKETEEMHLKNKESDKMHLKNKESEEMPNGGALEIVCAISFKFCYYYKL
jgi:hypothetical protein